MSSSGCRLTWECSLTASGIGSLLCAARLWVQNAVVGAAGGAAGDVAVAVVVVAAAAAAAAVEVCLQRLADSHMLEAQYQASQLQVMLATPAAAAAQPA